MSIPIDIPAERGLCRGCNYALRGLSGPRCPECGRAFDPADPATMNLGRPLGAMGRWLNQPIWWLTPVCLLLSIALLTSSIVMPADTLFLLLFLSIGAFWIIVFDRSRAASRRKRLPTYRPVKSEAALQMKRYGRARKIMLATALLLVLRIPFFIVFAFSVFPLARMGHQLFYDIPFGAPAPPTPCRVGAYEVRHIFIGCGGVWFDVAGGITLVYSPIPDGPRTRPTVHLIGPWHAVPRIAGM